MYDTTYGCLRLQRQFDNAGKNAGVNSRLQVVLCQLLLMNITKVHFSYLDMHDYLYGAIRQTLFERIESRASLALSATIHRLLPDQRSRRHAKSRGVQD